MTKTKQLCKMIVVAIAMFALPHVILSATNTTQVAGDWQEASTWDQGHVPSSGEDVVINHDILITSSSASLNSLTVNATKTLTFTNWTTTVTAANVTIATNATVTHSDCYRYPEDMSNRVSFVVTDMTIDGIIDVEGKGYFRGQKIDSLPDPSIDGQGPGGGSGKLTTNGGGGGGYGGRGGEGAATWLGYTYGSATNPVGPGSGGGFGADHVPTAAGDGGGSVRIDASGTIMLNGTINADGADCSIDWGGGGSGGAIWINCGFFAGSTGTNLTARGGSTRGAINGNCGGGGGGRIALHYSGNTYLGTHNISGGLNTDDSAYNGSIGSYVEVLNYSGSTLIVQGQPDVGESTPYIYGTHVPSLGQMITNSAVTPTTAVDGERYACYGWLAETGGVTVASGSTTQAIVQINADTTLTYLWTNNFQLTVSTSINGSVDTSVNGWYTSGTAVSDITATPDGAYEFLQWSGDVPFANRNDNPLTIVMDQPRTIVAHFVNPSTGVARSRSTSGDWFDWQNWSPQGVPGPLDDVTLSGGDTLLPYPVNIASMTVTNSGTILTFTNWSTTVTAANVTIAPDTTVTHSDCYRYPEDMSNRVNFVVTDMTINGTIDVEGKGYFHGQRPDYGPSIYGQGPGRGFGGHRSGGGGGYGGRGGKSSDGDWWGYTYGSATNPVGPGSGGGFGANHRPTAAGDGGGSVRIDASGTLTLNGIINANGVDCSIDHGGGGSGGAIWINSLSFAGSTGTSLTAKGGDTRGDGGSGGGGRIALYYSAKTYLGTHNVSAGVQSDTIVREGVVGTYEEIIISTGSSLTVQGQPAVGSASPYGYGVHLPSLGQMITNYAVTPTTAVDGERYACYGWLAETGGVTVASGSTTQAIVQINADTTLTFLWTNEFQLAVSTSINGSVDTAVNGWYTDGNAVSDITATPDGAYEFLQWSGDVPFANRNDNPLTIVMDQPRTIVAHFVNSSTGVARSRSTSGDWFDWQNWSPQGVPGHLDTVTLSGGDTLLPYPVNVASMTVTNSGTMLTFTNWETCVNARTVTIATGTTVTHSDCYRYPEDMSNRVSFVVKDITIDGTIDVAGKGYFRGQRSDLGPAVYGQGPGGGYGNVNSGGGGGGGYGGRGGKGNPSTYWSYTYGSATNPVGPGSGGGVGADHRPTSSGDGGGAVRINSSGTVTLNGTINADGVNCNGDWGGGGSGGAIWINCRYFTGLSGTNMMARGGSAYGGGGGGGGGRIAVLYANDFTYQGTNSVVGATVDGLDGTYIQLLEPIDFKGTILIIQ